jgi:PAS domain S-box-containing protein
VAVDTLLFDVQTFEYLTDAIVVVNDQSVVVYLNQSAAKLYSTSNDEIIGRPLSELFLEEWLSPADRDAFVSSLGQKGFWSGENFHVGVKSGLKFFAFSSVTRFVDSSGRKIGAIYIINQANRAKKGLDDFTSESNASILTSNLLSDLEMPNQDLANIIDVPSLQSMMNDLYAVTKIGFSVVDLKGNVLASTGGQDLCTKFHRQNPKTLWNCLESDLALSQGIRKGEFRAFKCRNNVWDFVTPLVIWKKHVGNIFSSQFFFEDELIDRELFVKQAEEYGFDKTAYLTALDKVPRMKRSDVQNLMRFYMKLSEIISKIGYSNLRLYKALSDQQKIEYELRKIQHDLNHAQNVAKAGSWRINLQTDQVFWSDETYRIFGVPVGTPLTYEVFLSYVHPEDRELVDRQWNAALQGKLYDVEHRVMAGTDVIWVHAKAELEFDKDGVLIGGFGTIQDITEQKKNDDKLHGLNRALRAISNSNQAIMRANEENAFLHQACRIIVEDCGYALVWIGLAADDEEKNVRPVAYAGYDNGYIESLKITWSETERGNGPTGKAIRTGKVQFSNNLQEDQKMKPWRNQALERGYASSISLPLFTQGKVFGALNIYSKEVNKFSQEEIVLLTELASDFSHGITLLRIRNAKEKVEATLLKTYDQYRLALEASNIGAWDYNFKTGEIFADKRSLHMFGLKGSENLSITYSDAMQSIHPDDKISTDEAVKAALNGENNGKFDHKFRVIWPDNSVHWIASHGQVHFEGIGSNRSAVRLVGVNIDITQTKMEESDLFKARQEWERTFDALPDFVAIIDNKYRILRMNKAFAEKLGLKPEYGFGLLCHSCIHSSDNVPGFCPHAKTIADGKCHTAEIYEPKLGGNLLVTTTPLKDESGKIIGSVHVARQINKT